jgi:serine-type D-Ala-D-Ala carboxypeptidase/endopeptidase
MSQRVLPDVPRNRLVKLLPLLLLIAALPACHQNITGDWIGSSAQGVSNRLLLHVALDPAGKPQVFLDDLNQGVRNWRARGVRLIGQHISFDFYSADNPSRAHYQGTLSSDARTMRGYWRWCAGAAGQNHQMWPAYAQSRARLERVALEPAGPMASLLALIPIQETDDDIESGTAYTAILERTDFRPEVRATACLKALAGWPASGEMPLVFSWQNDAGDRVKASDVDGDWVGILKAKDWAAVMHTGSVLQRLVLHVRTVSSNRFEVSLDLLDQGAFSPASAMAISCDNARLENGNLSLALDPLYANFEGRLSADGKALIGVWDLGDPALAARRELHYGRDPIVFTRADKNSGSGKHIESVAIARPIELAELKPVLDREFRPLLQQGILEKATGGGVVIGVLEHGQRRVFSYGQAKPDSIFEIGQITTTFTALALAQMVAQKRVMVDEPVRELLPAGIVAKPRGREIALIDLATHHSGLPTVPTNLNAIYADNPFAKYDSAHLDAFLRRNGVARARDTKYRYSWTGFGLLGYSLGLREGLSYEQVIEKEVAEPLHMDDTVITLSPAQRRRFIQGHTAEFAPAIAWDFDTLAGAAGLKSTAMDLLGYLEANLHPQEFAAQSRADSPAASLPAALALTHEPRTDTDSPDINMAMAWFFNNQGGVFVQDSAVAGYTAHVEFDPVHDRAIVVLYNRQDETPGQLSLVDRVAANIEQLMAGDPAIPLDYLSPIDRVTLAYAEQHN